MDTLSFEFFSAADHSLDAARNQFARREYWQALDTLAGLPSFLANRADALELKTKVMQALGRPPKAPEANAALRADAERKRAQNLGATDGAGSHVQNGLEEAIALFDRRKYSDALALLERGSDEWRARPEFHRTKAICHEKRSEYRQALESWTRLIELVPDHQGACMQIPFCQAILGRLQEAEQGFMRAIERFPSNVVAQFNLLFFRMKQQGILNALPWALEEVERLRIQSSNSPGFRTQLATLRERLVSLEDADQLRQRDPHGVLQLRSTIADSEETLRGIYERFEPIGTDCEFGLAQRKHGAEPMTLFRWAGVSPSNLLRLLRGGLSDFDAPSHYRLEVGVEAEYILKESVYQTESHTRINVADAASPETLLAQLARRQSFLKRKFIQTLGEGKKIFVLKVQHPMDPELVDELEDALHVLGAKMTLFVGPATVEHPGGSVEIASDSLVLGYLSGFLPNTKFDEWDAIVTRAYAHFAEADS